MQPSMRIHIDWHDAENVLQKEQRDPQSTQTQTLNEAGRVHQSVQSIATNIEVFKHITIPI